jgi:hypothetical protein
MTLKGVCRKAHWSPAWYPRGTPSVPTVCLLGAHYGPCGPLGAPLLREDNIETQKLVLQVPNTDGTRNNMNHICNGSNTYYGERVPFVEGS